MTTAVSESTRLDCYRQMFLIRRFEETLLRLFEQRLLSGTTHTCIGQEHIAVGAISVLDRAKDVLFSSHRCHGHFLAYCDDPYRLACELMGRVDGVNRGIGGSQHLCHRNFHSNGVQGGIVPNAVGASFAERARGTGAVTVVFMGDGTFGEGVVYESLNLAALWRLPVIFLVEDNRYAQSTPIGAHLAGAIPDRFKAFGIPVLETDTTDPLEVSALMADRVAQVRAGAGPAALVVHTYRLAPHSKGDDTRDPNEVAAWRRKDPLAACRARIDATAAAEVERTVEARLDEVFANARQAELTRELRSCAT